MSLQSTYDEQVSAMATMLAQQVGSLDDATRRQNQRLFVRDEAPIMVATIAFGMGINKSNVRFIVHHNLPENIESYYQQIGRAGRDGLRADCLLLVARQDIGTIFHFIEQSAPPEQPGKRARLQAMLRFVAVSYTHLRAHETVLDLVCRLLLAKKNSQTTKPPLHVHSTTTT